MARFKNKKTGEIVEEHLLYYIEKLKNNSNYKEVTEKQSKPKKENTEVEKEKPLQ